MQLPPDSTEHTSNFSYLKLPKSIFARFILLLTFIFIFIQMLVMQDISSGVIAVVFAVCVLWVANRFDQQDQQLQQQDQHLQQLQQQLVDLQVKLEQSQTLTNNQTVRQSVTSTQATQTQLIQNQVEQKQQTFEDVTVSAENNVLAQQSLETQPAIAQSNISETKPAENYQVMTSFLQAGIDWFKGGNSIVRIAIIILLIGVILLLRFASEYWQLTLSAKMAAIAAGGFALTALGYYLRQKRFDYAISLQGAGLGILFLVLFSSYHLQALSSVLVAYMALAALLASTLWLALKQNALFLAFIALGSGFIAPFLLNTNSHDIAALMAYLFALNAALAVIALFKPWRILNTVALLLTFGIGGLAIWQYAAEDQHFVIGCWVWAIFVLYLFMSIRYSQHIASVHQQIKNIPIVDTTLIFATPFMAFSLYAGLVDSDGYALSIASAVLAAVYLVVGYFIHRKFNQLSVLSQCFYGLGFVFFALILPFAFDAYWSSVGWAIHGVAMLYFGWRYQLTGAKYFSALLLMISGIASVVSGIFDEKSLLFASSVLMLAYAIAYYLFRAATQPEKEQGEQQLDHLLSKIFLVCSFFAASFFYDESLDRFYILHDDFSLSALIWYVVLSALWWWKDQQWSVHWLKVAQIILGLTAIHSLFYQTIIFHQADLGILGTSIKVEFLLIAVVWSIIFLSTYYVDKNKQTLSVMQSIDRIFAAIMMLFLGLVGTLWAGKDSIYYLSASIPVLLLGATLYFDRVKIWQRLWMTNPYLIVIGVMWLIWVSITTTGIWMLPYMLILNPIDILSILVFALLGYAIQPYLNSAKRTQQLINASVLLLSGLLLISSILLRMLHHYMDLPYWSLAAWQNSTIQMSLTILWASVALILTLLASRQAWRYIWVLGIAVLAIVIAKLIFLDLSHSHTITRIISFIGSGVIMLVIGYFAPLPPKAKELVVESEKTEA